MIKTKRKGKNRKSSFDDEGFVKFRISISSFHLLQFKSLHESSYIITNEYFANLCFPRKKKLEEENLLGTEIRIFGKNRKPVF